MRLHRLAARGFRNIGDVELSFPEAGVALIGENGQGKTNLLEAMYYPVFFRSFHGAKDQEVTRFGAPGFALEAAVTTPASHTVSVKFLAQGKKKQIDQDGSPAARVADCVGRWLAVAFLPQDLRLAAGPATERRRYLDRMLAIADPGYYLALAHYRSALAQRNAALRTGRVDLARAFDDTLRRAGARVASARIAWTEQAGERLAREMRGLGERAAVSLSYTGDRALADAAAWQPALANSEARDRRLRNTGIGPHRDDLRIELDGHSARDFGSTGQHRSVAIALKLLELATLEDARGAPPALLLDDVFAELDRDRQQRLAGRLAALGPRQVFLTSPRKDELPPNLVLPVWTVCAGKVFQE